MKKLVWGLLILLMVCEVAKSQQGIKELRWGTDNKIYVTLPNDSIVALPENNLFHSDDTIPSNTGYTFLPAGLDESFVHSVSTLSANGDSVATGKKLTLWSALHQTLGGGWPHFTNAILYALETRQLDLTAAIMQRVKTQWKPENPSENWKRTHEWKYYIPMDMKEAQNEYKWRLENKKLDDVAQLPETYRKLLLETNNSEYEKIKSGNDKASAARIDLVKLFLAVNYLGDAQIKFIASRVQHAAVTYQPTKLPQVLVLDPFKAAVILEMGPQGYIAKKIVFQDVAEGEPDDANIRKERINTLLNAINQRNQKDFEQQLKAHYTNKAKQN